VGALAVSLLLAAVILLIATNAALIGLSRLTFSMGQYRQLPERLRQVHPRFRTPYVAIIVFSIVGAITLLPGETELLATLYSFGAMLSFTFAHASLVKLRQRYPERERPWKPPGTAPSSGTPSAPPVVIKPRFGSWGRDVVLCEDVADVRAYLLSRRAALLAQP